MLHSNTRCLILMIAALLLFDLFPSSCASGGDTPMFPTILSSLTDPTCASPRTASGKISLAGLAYGPSHTGQDPTVGIFPSDEEIQADLPTLASLTHFIRIYSATGQARTIIQAAQAAHVCVALGISLSNDPVANAKEVLAAVQLSSFSAVHALIVGNEVLTNSDLSEGQLIATIEQVRARLGRAIPLTTAETPEQWLEHPDLAKVVDFITVHIYPFWHGEPVNTAISFLDRQYREIKAAFPGKYIVIGETGWPSAGPSYAAAMPGAENQARYLRAFIAWARIHRVQYFYFDAFDEDWKVHEFGVGTHWGLYQQNGQVKPGLSDLLPAPSLLTLKMRSYRDIYVNGLETGFSMGVDTSDHQYGWLSSQNGVLLLAYPAQQQWGVMFITVGQPARPGHRSSLDLGSYHWLLVDLRATEDGQCIALSIKDQAQPDNGSEISVQTCLRTQWSSVRIPLSMFRNVDLTQMYVVFEMIFQGSSSVVVEARNIRYSPS